MDEQGRLRHEAGDPTFHPGDVLVVEKGASASGPFAVSASGPSGSGRYSVLGVSFQSKGQLHGFCLLTSTVGWRRVGGNRYLAKALLPLIKYTQDVDGDGDTEFVVRSSTPVFEDAGLSEQVMSVTAYKRRGGAFERDDESTSKLREQIAHAYRVVAASERCDGEDCSFLFARRPGPAPRCPLTRPD